MLHSAARRSALAGLLFVFAAAGTIFAAPQAASADERTYTWSIADTNAEGVNLRLVFERHEAGSSRIQSTSKPVPLTALHGLSASDIAAAPGAKRFELVGEIGSLICEGIVGNGRGSGAYRFAANPSFERELARRGINPGHDDELLALALGNFQLSTLDAVLAGGFDRPTVADLADMTDHGVSADYVRAFKDVPLSPKSVRTLGVLHDHGVRATFVAALAQSHFRALTQSEIGTLADHGTRPELVRALAGSSYRGISAEQIAELADHGVSGGYISDLDRMGFHPNPVEIARLRDNGVTAAFIQRVRDHGYRSMSADDIIKLYQHGV